MLIRIVNPEGVGKNGRHHGTGGIAHNDGLRNGIGVATSVKDFVGTYQLSATVVNRNEWKVGHRDGVHPQVAIREVEAGCIQTVHIQCVRENVVTIRQLINRNGFQCPADGGASGVTHGDSLRHFSRAVAASILERKDTDIAPFAAGTAVDRVTIRNLHRGHFIAILESKITQRKFGEGGRSTTVTTII